MKKCIFYRTVHSPGGVKAVKTNGYYETLTDKNGHEITLCFHNPDAINGVKVRDAIWGVTEKSTGFLICWGCPRKNALEEAKKYIDLIYDKIQPLGKYQEIISKAYANEVI